MHQVIEGKSVYVVEFDTMPELPITGLTTAEQTYLNLTNGRGLSAIRLGDLQRKITYAEALTNAIETGIITEPGKYGIHLVLGTNNYEIHKIIE
jgi:hypothetical protein